MLSDPNPFPSAYRVSDDSIPTSSNARHSIRLTTLNLDVQTHIMSFLSRQDLSTLMRTCRYFLDACLRPLCARSGDLLRESRMNFATVLSFHQFLRIDAGPLSRVHLIKELWIAVDYSLYEFNAIAGHESFFSKRQHWSSAFLDILRHCHNLRRLRIDLWFTNEIPFPLFMEIISSLRHLEDLTLFLPQRLQDPDLDAFRKLGGLPLRRLAFLKFSEFAPNLHCVPLEGLPRSLVELEIDVCMPVSHPFPNIRTLGVRAPTSDTFVADATDVFPNVTQLILRPPVCADELGSSRGPGPLLQRARAHNKVQWQSERYREAWPLLSAVWALDLCMLYAAGFLRHMSSVSIPFRRDEEEAYVASVLADTSPSFLELRVEIDNLPPPPDDWQARMGPSTASVLRLKLLFEIADLERCWDAYPTEVDLFDEVRSMLPAFTSLTHMFIKFTPTESLGDEIEWPKLSRCEVRTVDAAIHKYLPRFGQACVSLRWVAFNVHNLGLQCWEVSRTDEEDSQSSCQWTKTNAEEGLAVLTREGMHAFKDVRQSLNTVV